MDAPLTSIADGRVAYPERNKAREDSEDERSKGNLDSAMKRAITLFLMTTSEAKAHDKREVISDMTAFREGTV